jgi:hypothetical protein
LKKAENANPHGAGLAWIDQKTKKVNWIKGKNVKSKTILKYIKKYNIQFPYIVHFRIASIGDINDKLCHPFSLNAKLDENKLNGSSKAGVLFHNGTLREYKIHEKLIFSKTNEKIKGDLSDSRLFAYIASEKRMGKIYLKECLAGQKIALLTPKGIKKYGDNWSKVEDIQMSNNYGISYNSCEFGFYGSDNWNNFTYEKPEIKINTCENSTIKNALNTNQTKLDESDKIIKNALNKNQFIQSEKVLEIEKLNNELLGNREKEKDEIEDRKYMYNTLDNDQIMAIIEKLPIETISNKELDQVYDYLQTKTSYEFDNLFCGSLDNDQVLEILVDNSKGMIKEDQELKKYGIFRDRGAGIL